MSTRGRRRASAALIPAVRDPVHGPFDPIQSGMDGVDLERRQRKGRELLLAHCARLDPETPTARERLEAVLGPALARKLVFALSLRRVA